MKDETDFWVCGVLVIFTGTMIGVESAIMSPLVIAYIPLLTMWAIWLGQALGKLGR